MREQYLVATSHREMREVYFKTPAGIEVDRYDAEGALYETATNPKWASLEKGPAELEKQVLEVEALKLPADERLARLTALLTNVPGAAVVQGWYYVERIVFLPNCIARIAYPAMTRQDTAPFDIAIESGTPAEIRVRRIPPEIISAEASPTGNGSFCINWGAKFVGFGQIYIGMGESGKLSLETEYMGKEFVKLVLAKLVDEAELRD